MKQIKAFHVLPLVVVFSVFFNIVFPLLPVQTVEALAIAEFSQCANDDGDGYATGNTGCRWINGNLQSNNSSYYEGDATPQWSI